MYQLYYYEKEKPESKTVPGCTQVGILSVEII
jgi:hypothetical protein